MSAAQAPGTGSRFVSSFLSAYLRGWFLRHFRALRLSRAHSIPDVGAKTILYSNHPSWWDPIVMLLIGAGPLAHFRLYAPIEAASLKRYPILRRFGLFGVRTGSIEGTRRFMAVSSEILEHPGNLLVMTAQGRFADARVRPAGLKNGVAHLLQADPDRVAVPVALEYVFWNERLPEALVAFGAPQSVLPGEATAATTARLDRALVDTQEALGAEAIRRDPDRFEVIDGSRRDAGGADGVFRRALKAFRHTPEESARSSASRP